MDNINILHKVLQRNKYIMRNKGYCNCCDSGVVFSSTDEWLRDNYLCSKCGSIPRERALMYCIEKFVSDWKNKTIHESSPACRGASLKIKKNCLEYYESQYFQERQTGIKIDNYYNQDLENQTFDDEIFDLVITQDVMEHVFNPEKAFSEIARTLKTGGVHVFTVPLVNKNDPTEICAQKKSDGTVQHLMEPEYHGNPIDENGSLVTRRWGYDIVDFIYNSSGLITTIVFIDDLNFGIRAEYNEVLISRKK